MIDMITKGMIKEYGMNIEVATREVGEVSNHSVLNTMNLIIIILNSPTQKHSFDANIAK